MTYNVHRCVGVDRRHSPERIADIIARLDPDIIALQELEIGHHRTDHVHQPRAIADILDMDFHYHPARRREDAGFGNAIMSRLPMRKVRSAILPTHPRINTQRRGALWASIQVDGHEVQVINTHLGLIRGERLLQAMALVGDEWLGHPDCRTPQIICGDFNATPRSPVYKLFNGTLRDADKNGHKPRRTWPSFCPVVRYDHVFVSKEIVVHKVEIPRTLATSIASDHLPVVIDFEVRSDASSARTQ
jgi:endonuclease/exonuclease/phosphatase family metal-dependent hydrolase